MSVRDEHQIPSPNAVLRKTKSPDKKDAKDTDKDSKKPGRRNSLLGFIAKHKQVPSKA